jgi:hypothetical protein
MSHEDSELIEEIPTYWDPLGSRTGHLVQRFECFDSFWHYGVALSDTYAVSWGPSKTRQMYYKGHLTKHSLGSIPLLQIYLFA